MSKKIIYFVKFARFSNTNQFVEEQLRRVFPEAEVRVLDTKVFFKRPSLTLGLALMKLIPSLVWDMIFQRLPSTKLSGTVLQRLQRDAGVFRAIGAFAAAQIRDAGADVWFTIQTQGMWDHSVPHVPNFIYTDSAALTNLYYKQTDRRLIPSQAWLGQERNLYTKASKVFVMSDHVRTSLIERYGEAPDRVEKIRVGANVGHNIVNLEPQPEQNKTILFVGVEWERKGGPQLVEAFRRLPQRHRDARLVIVGVSPQIDGPGIDIVGRVPPGEVSRHYRNSAIFCLPTKIEPFGIVFIEAMLHKLAVVAPAQGAMPDFIRHKETGMLVTPGDTDDLVEALTWLLDHPDERRRIADRGFTAIHNDYSWDAVGDRLRDAIIAVVGPVADHSAEPAALASVEASA